MPQIVAHVPHQEANMGIQWIFHVLYHSQAAEVSEHFNGQPKDRFKCLLMGGIKIILV